MIDHGNILTKGLTREFRHGWIKIKQIYFSFPVPLPDPSSTVNFSLHSWVGTHAMPPLCRCNITIDACGDVHLRIAERLKAGVGKSSVLNASPSELCPSAAENGDAQPACNRVTFNTKVELAEE
jgi:hypothetical protein